MMTGYFLFVDGKMIFTADKMALIVTMRAERAANE